MGLKHTAADEVALASGSSVRGVRYPAKKTKRNKSIKQFSVVTGNVGWVYNVYVQRLVVTRDK